MSENVKVPIMLAEPIAARIVERLRPYCDRIQIAGSIRRGQDMIGDIEIVACPEPILDLVGEPMEDHAVDAFDWSLLGRLVLGGHKYKKILLNSGIYLDLFLVTPPAEWGVIYLIRTGPMEFGKKAVTPRSKGGLLPSMYRFEEGAIWKDDHKIPTPEEDDVFRLLGIPYVEPKDRHA